MIGLDLGRSPSSDRFLFPAVGVVAGVVAFVAVHFLWPSAAGDGAASGRRAAYSGAQSTDAPQFAPSSTTRPTASPTTSPTGALYPQVGGGLADTAGAAGAVTIPAAGSGNHDGTPTNPAVFTATGLSRTYDHAAATTFDLSVDAGANLAHASQVRLSYDLTGDGTWDRVDTYRYFATDPAIGYEHYTSATGLASSSGSFGNLVGGTIKMEIWNALGASATTLGAGGLSHIGVPYAEPSTHARTSATFPPT